MIIPITNLLVHANNNGVSQHIAAIAMERQAEVQTYNVRDFARFPGLRWRNPL